MVNKEHLVCNWMLGHSDDTDLNLLNYDRHTVLHLWLHSDAEKRRQGGKQWKKERIEDLDICRG